MNSSGQQAVQALFNEACELRIRADDYDKPSADMDVYNAIIAEYNAVSRRLDEHGDFVRPLFIKALSDPRPPIRLMGALWVAHNAVELAPPVLVELSNENYGGCLGLSAVSMLRHLRKRGLTNLH